MSTDNVFDLMWSESELPEATKEKLMEDLKTLKFLVDITDLFTVKKIQVTGEFLTAIADQNSNVTDFLNEK